MRNIIYLFVISTLISCNSNGISDSLIEVNERQVNESTAFIQTRYYLDPIKVSKVYTKTKDLISNYNLLIQKIENGEADKSNVRNYLNELISLGIVKKMIYSENDFNYEDRRILKYQMQNVTLNAFQNIKSEFYRDYYSTYQTSYSCKRKENNIEIIPFIQDSLSVYKILLGKLKPSTNEFSSTFIDLDSLNRISLQKLNEIGLKEYIEGIIIFRKFDGHLDTLRIRKKINGC